MLSVLLRRSRDRSPEVRAAIAGLLGEFEGPRARAGVQRLLSDPSDRVRRQALFAFARRAGGRELPRLRAFLTDPAARVRAAAAVVLGRRKDRRAVRALLLRLESPGSWEKPSVLVALGRIGDRRAVPALLVSAAAPQPWLRVCAIHALAELRAPETCAVARGHLGDGAWSVRGAAAVALGETGSRADRERLVRLLSDPHPWPRRGALLALGRLGLRQTASRVRASLDDRSAEVRLAAVWALGKLGDRSARRPLARLLARLDAAASPGRPAPLEPGVLATDAEGRLFDATLLALRRLAAPRGDRLVRAALARARAATPDALLTRPVRSAFPQIEAPTEGTTLAALLAPV